MKKITVYTINFIGILLLLLISCGNNSNNLKNDKVEIFIPTINSCDGIYYFEHDNFPKNLINFIKNNHDSLSIVSINGDGTGLYGRNNGYYVVLTIKK